MTKDEDSYNVDYSELSREDLEKLALESISAKLYYELWDDIDTLSDAELIELIG